MVHEKVTPVKKLSWKANISDNVPPWEDAAAVCTTYLRYMVQKWFAHVERGAGTAQRSENVGPIRGAQFWANGTMSSSTSRSSRTSSSGPVPPRLTCSRQLTTYHSLFLVSSSSHRTATTAETALLNWCCTVSDLTLLDWGSLFQIAVQYR